MRGETKIKKMRGGGGNGSKSQKLVLLGYGRRVIELPPEEPEKENAEFVPFRQGLEEISSKIFQGLNGLWTNNMFNCIL